MRVFLVSALCLVTFLLAAQDAKIDKANSLVQSGKVDKAVNLLKKSFQKTGDRDHAIHLTNILADLGRCSPGAINSIWRTALQWTKPHSTSICSSREETIRKRWRNRFGLPFNLTMHKHSQTEPTPVIASFVEPSDRPCMRWLKFRSIPTPMRSASVITAETM